MSSERRLAKPIEKSRVSNDIGVSTQVPTDNGGNNRKSALLHLKHLAKMFWIHVRVHMRMNMHIHGMHIRTHLFEFRCYWMEDTRHDAYIMQGFEKRFT